MLLIFLAIVLIVILATRWYQRLLRLPPGPVLPLPLLKRIWFSKYYQKTNIEVFLALEKEYGQGGMFSAHIGSRRVVVITDYAKVQVFSIIVQS